MNKISFKGESLSICGWLWVEISRVM